MYNVYLAGPWFYGNQPKILDKVEKCLDSFNQCPLIPSSAVSLPRAVPVSVTDIS